MNISSSQRQYSLSPLCVCIQTNTHTFVFFFLLHLFYTPTYYFFSLFFPPPALQLQKTVEFQISKDSLSFSYSLLSFFILSLENCYISATHSRTSLLKGFLLLPRNSPIIWRLKPFLCSRKCATPMGVSGMKPREMRNWRPLSGFLFKKNKESDI